MELLKINVNKLENFLELSLFISFIAYNFGLVITLGILFIAVIFKVIDKFLLKKNLNPAVYLGIITICILLTKNIDFLRNIYENISGWII